MLQSGSGVWRLRFTRSSGKHTHPRHSISVCVCLCLSVCLSLSLCVGICIALYTVSNSPLISGPCSGCATCATLKHSWLIDWLIDWLEMARVNEGFTCHPHVYPRIEWAILPLLPSCRASLHLVGIHLPSAKGRRLSWPGWLVTYGGDFSSLVAHPIM